MPADATSADSVTWRVPPTPTETNELEITLQTPLSSPSWGSAVPKQTRIRRIGGRLVGTPRLRDPRIKLLSGPTCKLFSTSPPQHLSQPGSFLDASSDGAARRRGGKTTRAAPQEKWSGLGADPRGGHLESGIRGSGKSWKITAFLSGISCPKMKNIFFYAALPSACFLSPARSHSPLLWLWPDPVAGRTPIISTVPGLGMVSEGNYGYVNAEKRDGDVVLKGEDHVREESRTGCVRKFCCSHIPTFMMLSPFTYLLVRGAFFLTDSGLDLHLALGLCPSLRESSFGAQGGEACHADGSAPRTQQSARLTCSQAVAGLTGVLGGRGRHRCLSQTPSMHLEVGELSPGGAAAPCGSRLRRLIDAA